MADFIERVPPHNTEAEEHVLACLLIDVNCFAEVGDLNRSHFYHRAYGEIFAVMQALHKTSTAVDFITVGDKLSQEAINGLAWRGGKAFLLDLATAIPTTAMVEHYARIVMQHAALRDLIRAGQTITAHAFEAGAEPDEVQAHAMAMVAGVTSSSAAVLESTKDLALGYLERLEQRSTPDGRKARTLPTGITALDNAWRLAPGTMVIIGGRPAMGKTALAVTTAWAVAQHEHVLYCSIEVDKDDLIDRIVSQETGIDPKLLEQTEQDAAKWAVITATVERIRKSRLRIDDTSEGVTVAHVTKQAMQMASEGRTPRLIVVDYLQLMKHPKAERRDLQIAETSLGLRQLARKLGATVMPLAQLSREVESRTDKRPQLSDLRDSGALEQDADIVALPYRDDYYHGEKSKKPGVCEVIIAKFRNGAVGSAELYYDRTRQSFSSVRSSWGVG